MAALILDFGGRRRGAVSAEGPWHVAGAVLRLCGPSAGRSRELDNRDLGLKAELLDREVIDLGRERVARINDLVLAPDGTGWVVAAVDIGVRGLVRRLGLERALLTLGQGALLARSERVVPWNSIDPMETALARADLAWSHDAVGRLPREEQSRCLAGLQPGLRRRAATLLRLTQA